MNTTGSTNEMVDNYLQFQPLLLVTPYPDRLGIFSETSCTEELVWNVNHVGEAGPSRCYTIGNSSGSAKVTRECVSCVTEADSDTSNWL